MITPSLRQPSIDSIALQRLLNRPEDQLTQPELEHFFSRLETMALERLLNIIAIHGTLARDPRVVAALTARAGTMSRRELGISLRRCPRLLEADQVMAVFHALLEREVQGGMAPYDLAQEFVQRLEVDHYRALVQRAFPDGGCSSDVGWQFRLVLMQATPTASAAAPQPTPGGAAALRAEQEREDAWRARPVTASAELMACAYQELPHRDEVAAMDAAARAAWNGQLRDTLTPGKSGALYYLRYPLRDELFDAQTLALLQRLVPCERLDFVIDTEDLRQFVTRELVEQQVIERHAEGIWLERAPEWLDSALIERLRRSYQATEARGCMDRIEYEPDLQQLVQRLQRPGKEAQRRQLLEVLVEYARAGHACDFSVAGELLADNKTLWKSKDHGQALVLAALQRRRFATLRFLVVCGPPTRFKCLEQMEEALMPQVKAMHYAFGCALLTWARELTRTGDTLGTEHALAALGLLDPPRYFADDVHHFQRQTPLSEDARHLAGHVQRMAKSRGGVDAQVYALFQCISELQDFERGRALAG